MTLSLPSLTRFGVRAVSLLVLLLGAGLLAQSNATPAIRYVRPDGTNPIVVSTASSYSAKGTSPVGFPIKASVTLTVNALACGEGLSGPIWTGCLSTDWNTAGNWASGAVPTATDDVVIPSAPANKPVLSTPATAKSVEVQSGASLSITAAGSLTINNSKSLDGATMAFSNRGTVQNAGQLVLGNTATIGQFGFWNRGVANNAGGQISIDRSTDVALRNSSGTFTNTGAITIGSTSTAIAGSHGIRVEGGTVANNPGGDITINQISGRGAGVLNFATFVNASRLTIGNVALPAQDCIYNSGVLTNTATGEIRADRAYANGIWHQSGTFRNDGKIFIGTVANTGATGILIDGTSFVNSAGAEIQIDRVRRGLINRRNFTNAGQIRMGNNVALGEEGMLNGNGDGISAAVFTNQAGGLIQIDRTASGRDGLTNNVLATFTNAGTVTIGTLGSIGGNGIRNAGTFSNSACATLTIVAPINNGNSFLNAGLFTVSTTRPHSNTGTLTNNGLISYPQGNPIPNVVNNDVIAAPISSCSNTINPALQLGANSSQFSVGTTWYTNPALTQSAGTYDQGNNTFTATNLAPGSSTTLYFAATDQANGCTKTVSVSVTLNATVTASISPTNPTLTCASPTVSLTAVGGGSVRWNTGAITPVLSVSTAGTYSATVTSGSGCTAVVSVEVSQNNAPPTASLISSGGLSCAVSSVTLTANAGPGLTYQFSPGATPIGTTNQATVSTAGPYSVTVTNPSGCTASAETTVAADQSQPTVSITPPSGTLTCADPVLTLTASTSASSLTWSTGQTTPSISVSVAGTYSVTVVSANGCMAMAQATVSGTTSAPTAPTLSASPATSTTNQPITITANGCEGGTINWTALDGSGQANGNTYTFTQPGNYTLSATCSLNGCTSPPSSALSLQIRPGGFAITSVNMVNCQLSNAAKGEYFVNFTPQYSGANANPITFAVVNELSPTTAPAPYTLRLYTDNPVITLVANQAGNAQARYAYNWLASCQSGSSPNRPPTTTGIPDQTILQGQAYQLNLSSYFQDPDGQPLTYQATGLPAGLSLSGSVISGTPTTTGVSGITITVLDPGNLSASAGFQLTVNPAPTTPAGFAIVGVSTVSCEVLSAGLRRVTFTPQYSGVSGQPISFSVVNELSPTTNAGPYSLNLYTDNPAITLSARQGGTVATYRYNWLAVCTPSARVGAAEASSRLQVRVLGNPVEGEMVEVEIRGATGQPVQLNLVNLQGKPIHAQRIEQAGELERVRLPLGASNGVFLLHVSTPTQQHHIKLLRF